MEELIAFMRARLNEDERLAQAADQDSWTSEYDEFRCRGGAEFEHLLHHSPARVLREVEAKQRLVDLHQPGPLNEWDQKSYGFSTKCAGESWVCYGDGEEIVQWPCDHLKWLALPYSDHPDYRAEWRPE